MYCKKCGEKTEGTNNLCFKCQSINKNKITKRLFDFIFSGRIGRLRYFFYIILFSVIFSIPFGIMKEIFGMEAVLTIFNFALFVFIPITAKRLRDMGFSGYYAIPIHILGLISDLSLLSYVVGLYLLFKKGDDHINKYGDILQTTKKMKIIMFFVLIIFLILSILFLLAPLFI